MILDEPAKRWIGRIRSNSHAISVAKAVSWRIVGTFDTMMVSWFVTGKLNLAFTIASVEVVTKIVLFYLHEQGWNRIWLRNEDE